MPADALTRRTLGAAALGLAGAVAARGATAATSSDLGISTSSAAIHQEVVFKATPARVYKVLTDEKLFGKLVILSGAIKSMALKSAPTLISPKPGGAFSMFGGYITGRQLELQPGVRIVQVWRSASWAPHLYSIVRFELSAHPDGAKLVFDHVGFPNDEAQSLATGWQEHYWAPLAKVLAE
jgi:activator of HSP90 ATPase